MKLSNLLPYENLTVKSSLSQDKALQKLANIIEPANHFEINKSIRRPYKGEIKNYKFQVIRNIKIYRNSFLPVITGEITSEIGGCSIDIKMRLHLIVTIVLGLCLLPIIFILFICLLSAFVYALSFLFPDIFQVTGALPVDLILILMGFLLFTYSLTTISFKSESAQSKLFFQNLFQ
jgi:hypothetical protein